MDNSSRAFRRQHGLVSGLTVNKRIVLTSAIVLLLFTGWFGYQGYRHYKARAELALVEARQAVDRRQLAERERRAAAELEAQRLAALQTDRKAAEPARHLEALRDEQLAA